MGNVKLKKGLLNWVKLIVSIYILAITWSYVFGVDYSRFEPIIVINTIILLVMFIDILRNMLISSLYLEFRDKAYKLIFATTCFLITPPFVVCIIHTNGISPILAIIIFLASVNGIRKRNKYEKYMNYEKIKCFINRYIKEKFNFNDNLINKISEKFLNENKDYLILLFNDIDDININSEREGFKLYFDIYLNLNSEEFKIKKLNINNRVKRYLEKRSKNTNATFDFKNIFFKEDSNVYDIELNYIYDFYLRDKCKHYKFRALILSISIIFFIVFSDLALNTNYSYLDNPFRFSSYMKNDIIGFTFSIFGKLIKDIIKNTKWLTVCGCGSIFISIFIYYKNIKNK